MIQSIYECVFGPWLGFSNTHPVHFWIAFAYVVLISGALTFIIELEDRKM